MRIQLEHGKRYRATVKTTHTTPVGLALLRTRLQMSGFDAIGITPERGQVTIQATYRGKDTEIELAHDVDSVQQVS